MSAAKQFQNTQYYSLYRDNNLIQQKPNRYHLSLINETIIVDQLEDGDFVIKRKEGYLNKSLETIFYQYMDEKTNSRSFTYLTMDDVIDKLNAYLYEVL